MTVFASFILPDIASKYLAQNKITKIDSAYYFTQLLCPVSIQLISTPLHLYGLDLYNRQNISFRDRLSFIKKEYVKTAIARMSRILPAFGIGGIINKRIKTAGRDYLQNFDFHTDKNRMFM